MTKKRKNKTLKDISAEIHLDHEPKGRCYHELLKVAQHYCSHFSLVWQEQLKFEKSADVLAMKLQKHLLKEGYTNKWPGTELVGHKAKIRYYALNKETITILKSTNRLYAWIAPELPEDLTLYVKSNDCWLVSVSHENMGWINSNVIYNDDISSLLRNFYANGILERKY